MLQVATSHLKVEAYDQLTGSGSSTPRRNKIVCGWKNQGQVQRFNQSKNSQKGIYGKQYSLLFDFCSIQEVDGSFIE